jgi:hypothetical protein
MAGLGGLNASVSTQYVTPTAALGVLVPNLLRALMSVVRENLRAEGILVHLNNLEQLSEEDERKAAMILRDIRDDVLMEPGFHFLLAGTNEAIRHVIAEHEQLRSVFNLPRPLPPLTLPEVQELLRLRYRQLAVSRKRSVSAPVEDPALAALYAAFEGDLRGLLTALEHASESLIELGASGGAPMRLEDILAVLRARYLEGIEANLRESEANLLGEAAEHFGDRPFTQTDLQKLRSRPSKGLVSEMIGNVLVHRDYTGVGSEVEVKIYADRLVIQNPGSLMQGLTTGDLKRDPHPSRKRNPLIAEVASYDHWVERAGTGTTRMIKLCEDARLPAPEFEDRPSGFTVTFRKNLWDASTLESLGLNDRQVQGVMHVKLQGSMSLGRYRELVDTSERSAARDLSSLVKRGLLRKEGGGVAARYVFGKLPRLP